MIPFTKMQATCNDFVLLDGLSEQGVGDLDFTSIVPAMCARRTGIGADGVVILQPAEPDSPPGVSARMRIFNADGSEAEMCGNGTMCLVRFAAERLGIGVGSGSHASFSVQLGTRVAQCDSDLDSGRVRVLFDGAVCDAVSYPVPDVEASVTVVHVGNPHAIEFVDDSSSSAGLSPFDARGRVISTHPAFPSGVNYHAVEVIDHGNGNGNGSGGPHLNIRSWERGVGETLSCGTGCCAAVIAACATGRLKGGVYPVACRGGTLRIEHDPTTAPTEVAMGGGASFSFDGVWDPSALRVATAY